MLLPPPPKKTNKMLHFNVTLIPMMSRNILRSFDYLKELFFCYFSVTIGLRKNFLLFHIMGLSITMCLILNIIRFKLLFKILKNIKSQMLYNMK